MKYCINCGSRISEGASFCTECGTVLKAAPKNQYPDMNPQNHYSGAGLQRPQNRTAEFIANRELQKQAEKASDNNTKGKKPVGLVLAVVLVLAFVFTAFIKPGFLREKEEPDKKKEFQVIELTPEKKEKEKISMVTVAEGIIDEAHNSISGESVTLSVNPYFIDEGRKATISKASSKVKYDLDGTEVMLSLVDCKVEGISSGSLISISMPLKCDSTESACAGYMDENGVMHPIPHYYDSEAGMLTITTTHLSKYCGFTVKNDRMSNATLAYVFADEMFAAYDNIELDQAVAYIEAIRTAESDFCMNQDISEGLSNGLFVTGNMVSAAGLYEGMFSTVAEGAGTTIFSKGTIGTVGEIMNSNWGRAGTWLPGEMKYGPKLKEVSITDRFASKYPSSFLEKTGKLLNRINLAVSVFSIGQTVLKEGLQSDKAASAATTTLIDTALFLLGEDVNLSSYGLNAYLLGVSLFEYTLNEFYTTATEGREQVYVKAYQKYYSNKGTDGAYRSSADWIRVFRKIIDDGGSSSDITAEIDRYVNEFWVKADEMGPEYLDSIMTEDDMVALGAAAQGGLNEALRQKISRSYKQTLYELMPDIFRVMSMQRQAELMEKCQADYDKYIRQMNQTVTVSISSDYSGNGKSGYEGCIVRFKDIAGKVEDPKKWQTTLNSEGSGSIRFTFLGHLMVNAGTTVEVVRTDGDREKILQTLDFVFKTDNSGTYPRLYAVLQLHEDSEEQEIIPEPDSDTQETDDNGMGETSNGRPVHFVFYGDSLKRDGSDTVPLIPLADSFRGTSVDISGNEFTLTGADSNYHMGKEDMLRMIEEAGDVDGELLSYNMDWTVSETVITGKILDGGSDDYAELELNLNSKLKGYSAMSARDEYGTTSMEQECEGGITGEGTYPGKSRPVLVYEELDGRERWVLHLHLYVVPKYTQKTHEVSTDTDGRSTVYDNTDEAGYSTYHIQLIYVAD